MTSTASASVGSEVLVQCQCDGRDAPEGQLPRRRGHDADAHLSPAFGETAAGRPQLEMGVQPGSVKL